MNSLLYAGGDIARTSNDIHTISTSFFSSLVSLEIPVKQRRQTCETSYS